MAAPIATLPRVVASVLLVEVEMLVITRFVGGAVIAQWTGKTGTMFAVD